MRKHYDRERIIWDSQELSTNETILLLALNSFVDANGECYPGQELLARMCKFSDRTVRNTVRSLQAKGIIDRSHRYKDGKRTSDMYRVNFSLLEDASSREKPTGKSLPENQGNLPENIANLPENIALTTGKYCTNLPERDSRDLSSKNYPEELPREKRREDYFPRPLPDPIQAQFAPRPWRKNDGSLDGGFCEFVGKLIDFEQTGMHHKTKGRGHILNLQKGLTLEDLEKLQGYWDDYQEQRESGGCESKPRKSALQQLKERGLR